MSFVHLHLHSHYSLLDGFGSPKAIVERAKELGCPAVALTDHGVTYGLVEFFNEAKKAGIKPILGCEIYVARRTRFDKDPKLDTKPYHLTLLAETNEGYENLLKLVTQANIEGFYYKPRVDYGLLKAHSKGLIALSGCATGHLARTVLSENDAEADEIVRNHIEIFGRNNYFLEIQDQPLNEDQGVINEGIKKLAKKFELPLVLTNDVHYPRPEDSDAHDILLCIQTGSTVNDDNRMRYTGDFSMRDVDDLKQAVKDCPEAIENTIKVAERCNVELSFGNNLIPSYDTPQNEKADVYLRQLCEEGLGKLFGKKKIPEDYLERLDYELDLVHKMGFDTYFLIVYDFVKYAKDSKIVVGPGRGSAAGSIIAWALNITTLDPIKHGLFFERFLNPERISMPDIDIDFADNRRDEVLEYVVGKYGRENVAQIITFGTMQAKAVVRDVGRALGYPYAEVDTLAKLVPPTILGKHNPLGDSVKDDPDLRNAYENDPRAKELLDYAIRLEGTVRHAGTHACAVVISEEPLVKYSAMQYGAGGGTEIVSQYSAGPLEQLGLLKMDFLGLRNLTIIDTTIKILKRTQKKEIEIGKIPRDDKKTFKLLQQGDTTGVFQLESGGMKRYLKELKSTVFEDIVAMGALYRPGPMEWIPDYIKGKHAPKKVKYFHESFKPILESTYGVAVYQEQILQIARDFAGFSLGEADILRKAVGKKIPELLAEQRDKFVKGAIENGHKEKFSKEVFEKVIEPFAGYGFNRAHATCYGLISYQTAYLKANFPIEFMTALLSSDVDNTDRVVLEVKECSEMGISVLPPSINESLRNFTVVDKKTVRFGLQVIKGVGEGSIREVIAEREKNGKFNTLEEFARRVPSKLLNKKLIQSLAYAGALDKLGDRGQIAENFDEIVKYAKSCQDKVDSGQQDIFGIMDEEDVGTVAEFNMRDVPPATTMQKLKWEKEFLGMYVSGHPLRGLRRYIKKKGDLIGELTLKQVGKSIKICGLVTGIRKILTKSGSYMAIYTVEDTSGSIQCVMFPRSYSKFGDLLAEDAIMAFSGRFDNKRGQFQLSCDVGKVLSAQTMTENAKEMGSYDPDDMSDLAIRKIDDILAEQIEEEENENRPDDLTIENFDISDSATSSPDVFIVKIPEKMDPQNMAKLKKLLIERKGNTPVELHINGKKKLKLPISVDVTESLADEVKALVGN